MGFVIAFNFQWGLKEPSDLNGSRRGLQRSMCFERAFDFLCVLASHLRFFGEGGRSSYLHLVAGVFPEPGSQSGGGYQEQRRGDRTPTARNTQGNINRNQGGTRGMRGGTMRLITMGHDSDGSCLRQCPLPFNGGFFYIQRAPHSKGGLSEWNGPRFKRGATSNGIWPGIQLRMCFERAFDFHYVSRPLTFSIHTYTEIYMLGGRSLT